MPPAVQPGMKSVLSDFVHRPDLTNKKQNIKVCYYDPRLWKGCNFFKLLLCVIQQTHKQTCMKKTRRQTPKC